MDTFAQVQTLFEQAVALPQGTRTAFIDAHSSDPGTRAQVLSLLQADRKADEVLQQIAGDLSPLMVLEGAPEIPGYELLSVLGEGGMGIVYEARDVTLQRSVALKILPRAVLGNPQYKQRFVREARAMAALQHANIGEIYELGENADGIPFIASALCEGRNLSELLAARNLSLAAILNLLIQLCDALAAAHQKNIFHRDIKPANIIVDDLGNIKLVDFGIAKMEGDDLSQTGQLLGTFNYMAPEQFSGNPIDARTDLWAVGILLYQALAGEPPFQADNAAAIMYQLFNSSTPQLQPPLPELAAFNQLLQKTLSHNREHRFGNASALAVQLRALQDELRHSGQGTFVPSGQSPTSTNHHSTFAEIRNIVVLAVTPWQTQMKAQLTKYHADVVEPDSPKAPLQACFGYPRIQEASADIALKAAIELAQHAPHAKLALHVVPMVFARQEQHTGITRKGDSLEASRALLERAPSGKITLSDAVNKRLRVPFEATPEAVLSLSPDACLRNTQRQYRTPFCGRQAELGMLLATWQGVLEGQGRAVLLSGEAGLGKTRLLAELQRHTSVTPLLFQTDPSGTDSAFQPLINGLKDYLLSRYGSIEVASLLQDLDLQHRESAEALRWLLGEDIGTALNHYSAQALRTASFKSLHQCLQRLAQQQPLLVLFEDLHWADASSLEWLQYWLEQPVQASLLLIITGRPQLFERWQVVPNLLHLPLTPLPRNDARSLAQQLTNHTQDIDVLCDTAAGNPLFIEEYSRMLGQPDATQVPETLEDLLLSRVDHLGDAKRLAQTAAVMGRSFSARALAQLDDASSSAQQLQQLQKHQVIFTQDDDIFCFSHALIRDALYASLQDAERRALHHRYALQRAKTANRDNYEEVALHFSAAGQASASLPWWLAAAEAARDRHALRETLRLCQQGLQALSHCDGHASHKRWELPLLLVQGPALIALNNYAHSEVGRCYGRAVALCENLNERSHLFTARMGLWSHLCVRARHRQATELAVQLLADAQAHNDPDELLEAHLAAGTSTLFTGQMQQAKQHLSAAIARYQPQRAAHHIALYGQDPGMAAYTFRALLEEALGNGGAALSDSEHAVATARASQHPFSLGFALAFAVHIHLRQQSLPQAMALRAEVQQLSKQQELHVFALLGAVQESLMLIGSGQLAAGVAALEQAILPYRAFGTEIFLTSWYALLAVSHVQLHNLETARDYLQKAQQQLEISGEALSQPYVQLAEQAIANSTPSG